MAIVVTGAAGFVGGHLVAALATDGRRVIGIDRRAGTGDADVDIVADLAEPGTAEVEDALADADAVFHLAAFPGVRASGPEVALHRHRDNIVASQHVLAAVPLSTPLIVTSSSSVYGGSQGRPCAEQDRLAPRGEYAASKVELERMCAKRVSQGGLVAVARPFTVMGPGQRPDMAAARWIDDARNGRPLTILGSPDRTRDVTDVADVVEGLIRIADRGVRATVNLGTGTSHRIGDIAAAAADAVGVPLRTVDAPAGDQEPPHSLADTARCEALLGFVPANDLRGLVRRQVDSIVPAAVAS